MRLDSPEAAHRAASWALRWYRPHRLAFVGTMVLLHAVNIMTGAPWWALWPLLTWGVVFFIHYFTFKSLTVDEDWSDERIEDMRWRAYDFGHIEDLEDRIRADDYSTRPAHRRDPDWWRPGEGEATEADDSGPGDGGNGDGTKPPYS